MVINDNSQLYLERITYDQSKGGNQSGYLVNADLEVLPPDQAYYTGALEWLLRGAWSNERERVYPVACWSGSSQCKMYKCMCL